jgi:hypothetical protein
MELSEARSATEQHSVQRNQALAEQDANIATREKALSDDKAQWQQTVDKAIVDERTRLESEHARFREESESLGEERVQALLEEKTQELIAEHEVRESQMRGQVEAHVAKLLAEFDARLETVRDGYETRLNEQETMLEDERRRLETEIVRLREALTDAQQAVSTASTSAGGAPAVAPVVAAPVLDSDIPLPASQSPDEPALDFELNESLAAAIQTGDEASDMTTASSGPEPDLELQLEETEVPPSESATELPATAPDLKIDLDEATAKPEQTTRDTSQDVPVIEIPESESDTSSGDEKTDRVISANQLADIRQRMQDKMRAAKSR